jgi:hypothetical protein
MQYSEDLIKRLASGEDSAKEEIKNLSTTQRISVSWLADEYREKHGIELPKGDISVFESKPSVDFDGVADSISKRNEETKIKEEIKNKIRQEQLEKEVKAKVMRSRAGLDS